MGRYELGIVDTRNLISSLEEIFKVDFRNFALTSFKRRVEDIIFKHKLNNVDGLINRFRVDKTFFDTFLFELAVKGTELFRDPSLWRIIQEKYIPVLKNNATPSKVLFAGNEFGEDLYSFMILLKEENLLNKVKVYATVYTDMISDYIKTGEFDSKIIETNTSNYNKSNLKNSLSDYYRTEGAKSFLDSSLIENVNFLKQNTIFDNYPKGVKMTFFRNQMIYYNQVLSDKVVRTIYDCMVPGGFMFLGSKESIQNTTKKNDFIVVDQIENIYKRKI